MRLVRRALEIVLVTFVVGVLGLAAAAQLAPTGGFGLYAVRSPSMAPALAVGDVVVTERVPTGDIRAGDVVTVSTGAATVTHRVVAVRATDDGPLFQTQGDANATADPVAVRGDQLRGRLALQLPLLGFLLAMISMPTGVVALLSMGGTLLTALWLLDEVEADDEEELEETRRRLELDSGAALS